jgi:type I restriction enzyme S subunit
MGELCSIQSGKSDTKDAVLDGPYAFFDRSKTIKRSNRFIRDCEALIVPGEGTEFLPRHFRGKFDLHQRAYALFDFSPRVEVRFLYYYLHHVSEYFPRVAVGATVKSLRLRHFEQLPVRLVDIEQQRRIVAILDEAFEGIATAKAHAERNLRNARATFESILETVYTDRVGEVPKERLEALCEQGRLITYGVIKLGDPIEGGVPCLRTSNVRWLSIDTNGMKRIAPSLSAEYSRTILRGGEVLVNVRGTLGGVAVVPDFMAGWNVSREVAVVPIGSLTLNPEYAAFWIGSRASQDWLSGVKKGAAYTGINIEDLRNVPVPVTSHDAQSQIVDDLKAARAATRKIEEIYSRKLAALDELKQSLLHQAFSGQL